MLASATAAFFLGQTAPVAGIIKLAEGAAMRRVWLSIVQLSFPYYVLSAGMTSMVNLVSHHLGWQAALVVFPVMYGFHHSYRLYFGRAAEALRTHRWQERPARERRTKEERRAETEPTGIKKGKNGGRLVTNRNARFFCSPTKQNASLDRKPPAENRQQRHAQPPVRT